MLVARVRGVKRFSNARREVTRRERALVFPQSQWDSPAMSTLAEIESAVTQLPRPEKAELLRFVAAQLRETSAKEGRTGAELARLWPVLPHLADDEAADFERDLASPRTAAGGQPAPAWE